MTGSNGATGRTIADTFKRIWAERRLYLLSGGQKIFVSMVNEDAFSIYIYFSDNKIIQVGKLLTIEEREILRREWPKGIKTIRLEFPESVGQEPVTREELRKALEDIERKNDARATESRIEAARQSSLDNKEWPTGNWFRV